MKNLKLFSLLALALFSCALVGCDSNKDNDNSWDLIIEEIVTNDEAINYNDNLVDLTSECFASEDSVRMSYEAWTAADLQVAIDNTVALCNESLNNVSSVDAWENDASLRDWVIDILMWKIDFYEKMQDLVQYQDYSEEDLQNLSDEEVAEYEAIIVELDEISKVNDAANEALINIQEEFAKNHNYELEAE